jgi:hypothetical protein
MFKIGDNMISWLAFLNCIFSTAIFIIFIMKCREVKYYKNQIDQYYKKDNSFVVIKYRLKNNKPICEREVFDIKPRSTLEIVPKKELNDLISIIIQRV